MNAAALNTALTASAGAQGHGAAAAAGGQASGPMAGFEALLAALFPQADAAAGSVAPQVAGTPATAPAKAGPKARPETDLADGEPDVTADDAEPTVGNAGAALAASLAAQAPPPLAASAGSSASGEDAAPLAAGNDKTPGVPAQPALANANGHAGLAEKFETPAKPEVATGQPAAAAGPTAAANTAEASAVAAAQPETTATEPPVEDPPASPAAADTAANAAPRAWGRDKPKGAPAAPALTNAPPQANLPEKAATPAKADAPAAQPQTQPADAPVAELPPSEAPLAAAATVRGPRPDPAPPPAPPGRATKSERARALTEAGPPSDTKPLEATGKTPPTKPVDTAARPAAANVEMAEAKPEHAKAASDAPDATPQGETRAASSSAAPAAPAATHVVRGSPETVASLAAQIVKKLEGRSTRFDVELDPAGLGKVDVRVEIGAHGRITAAMTCENPQAASELRARASELQRALEQAGFNLSGGLSFDVAGDRGQQGQGWQNQDQTPGQTFRSQAFRAALDSAEDASGAAVEGALRLRRGVVRGLDLRI